MGEVNGTRKQEKPGQMEKYMPCLGDERRRRGRGPWPVLSGSQIIANSESQKRLKRVRHMQYSLGVRDRKRGWASRNK